MKKACPEHIYPERSRGSRGGQSLVEVLVSLGMLAVVIVAFTILSSQATKLSRRNLEKVEAAAFVQDGMEKVRNIRDTNVKAGRSFDEWFIYGDPKGVFIRESDGVFSIMNCMGLCPQMKGDFERRVYLTKIDNTVEVRVKVTWGSNTLEAVSILTEWT